MVSSRAPRTAPNQPKTVRNALLAALPNNERDRIVRSMEIVPLTLKEIVQKVDDPVDYVHFPGGGFLSVVTVLEDGRMVEVTG